MEESESESEATDEEDFGIKGHKAAWADSDDERISVSLVASGRLKKLRVTEDEDVVTGKEFERRLRRQFERVYPVPKWALPSSRRKKRAAIEDAGTSDSEAVSDAEDAMNVDITAAPLTDLLNSNSSYTSGGTTAEKKKRKPLRPEKIDIARLSDANQARPSHSAISSVSFHPQVPLLLEAGLDSTVRLFHIDGKVNPASTSAFFQSTPIHTAEFHPDGRRVFVAGRRRYFHTWDLESGTVEKITRFYGTTTQRSTEKFRLSPDGRYMGLLAARGNVNILDARTCQFICAAKVEGRVADFGWYGDGSGLAIATQGAEVSEYDMRARGVSYKWRDEGGVGTTTIAVGGKGVGRWAAIGSQSGIVNIYDRKSDFLSSNTAPKPLKTIENLVTPVSVLKFSADAQVLAMASHWAKDALKLVHLPSASVYKNWPTSSTPLGRINCMAWSPEGTGMLAVGNEQGKVRLWEVRN